MKDKFVLITGASSGIGKATATGLAGMGATVLMVCRDESRGRQAQQEIMNETGNSNVLLLVCDLSLIENVKDLAEKVNSTVPRLDVLINNAAILPGSHTLTREGFEISWATNYMSPFVLTNLLFYKLHSARRARIINVASEAHRLGQIDLYTQHSAANYSSFTAYCDTKLANVMFTYELTRRLENTEITANCLHPGAVATNLGLGDNSFYKLVLKLTKPFLADCRQGAEAPLYLATSRDLCGISGCYFKGRRAVKSSDDSYNAGMAKKLWQQTEKHTGIYTDY